MSRNDTLALTLLSKHGRTATAFQTLAPGMHHWFAPSADGAGSVGFVGYAEAGNAWVVAGEPVASRTDTIPVAEAFVAHAAQSRKRVAFFATEGALAASPRFRRVLIGEQPVWNPQEWPETLRSTRSLREQLRRARAKGVAVRRIASADQSADPALLRLMNRWLATRAMPAMHFLVELEPFVQRERRRLYVAERQGEIVALLSLAPVSARNGWLFEHLLRDPAAPNGTAELLVDDAMRELREENVTWATLGLAPLSGPVSGWLRLARSATRPLFNFAGLAAFKRKLRPASWEPIYLAYPRERISMMAMRDGLRAFAGGSLIAFGVRTVARGPEPLLRALQLSLIPWTVALALWPASPWFPSPAIKWAWVVFDVLLLGALHRLRTVRAEVQLAARATGAARASRNSEASGTHELSASARESAGNDSVADGRTRSWQLQAGRAQRLSIAVAAAVTLDTALTVAQAAWWNVSRARTVLEMLMIAAACAGPALASVVLWGAVRRQRVVYDLDEHPNNAYQHASS
ncbi:MAG: phosphatidylglycerol lysyltransferase domain-containing protein [Gemmatimonas sp.]